MLVTNTRHACTTSNCGGGVSENLDWVLKPNTTYTQENGTQIGTTNASGIFQGTLSSSFGLGSSTPWTGLSNAWVNTATNCSNYTDGTAGGSSSNGDETAADSYAWSGLVKPCNSTWTIYCVEQ